MFATILIPLATALVIKELVDLNNGTVKGQTVVKSSPVLDVVKALGASIQPLQPRSINCYLKYSLSFRSIDWYPPVCRSRSALLERRPWTVAKSSTSRQTTRSSDSYRKPGSTVGDGSSSHRRSGGRLTGPSQGVRR